MVFTNSYGASCMDTFSARMVNSLGGRSGLETTQRMCASSLAMVMMSRTRGIFCSVTGSLVSSAAAIAGNAAFFAPLICTVPFSFFPP